MNRPISLLQIALASAFLATAGPAFAQVPQRPIPGRRAPVADRVDVQLMVVHAHNAHRRVDARLQGLLAHLRHLSYTGYDVLDTRSQTLSGRQEATFPVVGDRRVKVQLIDHDASNARLRIRMFNREGKVLDTTVSVHRNRSFIVMGPSYDGGVLMLPITARY